MIILRNNIYERNFSVNLNFAEMKRLAQQQGLSLKEVWTKLRSDPAFARKYSTLAQARQNTAKTRTALGVSSNPKIQEMRAKQAQAQQAFEAAKPKPTQQQLAQARRNAAKAERVSLQDVGTAKYSQPTQVNTPGVYRNNAFNKPENIERWNKYKEYASGK